MNCTAALAAGKDEFACEINTVPMAAHDRRCARLAVKGLRVAATCLVTAMLALPASQPQAEQRCPSGGSGKGRATSVDEGLDLTLEDGTKVKIAGIEPPRPTPESPALDVFGRDQLAKWLTGLEIEFAPLGPGRDRWGRITALVFAPPPDLPETQGQALLPVGVAIIDAGLARYDPNTLPSPCRNLFLAAEVGARASGLGLWADPYYAVIVAGSRDSLTEKAGSSIIVEGRVTGLSFRKSRIRLYLGPRRSSDFSVTILPRSSKEFEAAHSRLANLTGQNIRVRGLLETRFGPQIEVSNLDALEVLGQEQDPAAFAPLK
jgi:endonuclease YncB( thermonuclease family)